MRKFLVLFILAFVFVVPTFGKGFCDFEDPIADTHFPLNPWVQYRDLGKFRVSGSDTNYLVSVVNDVKWASQGGHHAAELRLDTNGAKWLLMCKAKWEGEANALDTLILPGVGDKDTIFYYLFIPCDAPIDSIFIFARDTDWTQEAKTVYRKVDLNFGCWNELFDRVDSTSETFVFPLVQCDFEIHTDSSLNHAGMSPACTLYFDCPSTIGSLLGVYDDTVGQREICGGIIEGSDGITVEASINSVKVSLSKSAPITVSIYNVIGQRVYQSAGFASAGENILDVSDLANGVYTVRVISGVGSAKLAKLLVVK